MAQKYQSPMMIEEQQELNVAKAAPADAGAVITAVALIAAAVYTKDCGSEEANQTQ